MAAAIRARTAVIIFTVLWLTALGTVCVVGATILLYDTGITDEATIASIAVALVGAVATAAYLILQATDVSQLPRRPWSTKTWLLSACIHLPRALMLCWLTATVVGLVTALKRTACQNIHNRLSSVKAQVDSSCWLFRAMIITDAVLFVLTFRLHWMLQVQGHDVPVSLISLKYSRVNRKRRTMLFSPNGSSATFRDLVNGYEPDNHSCTSEPEKHYYIRRYSTSQGSLLTATSFASGPGPPAYRDTDSGSALDTPTPIGRYASRTFTRDSSSLYSDARSTLTRDPSLRGHQPRPLSDIPSISASTSASLRSRSIDNPIPSAYIPNQPKLRLDTSVQHKQIHRAALCSTTSDTKKSLRASLVPSNHTGTLTTLSTSTIGNNDAHSSLSLPSTFSTKPQDKNQSNPHNKYEAEFLRTQTPYNKSQLSLALPSPPQVKSPHPPDWCPAPLHHAPLSADPAIRNLSSPSELAKRASQLSKFDFGWTSNRNSTTPSKPDVFSGRCVSIVHAPREMRVKKNRGGDAAAADTGAGVGARAGAGVARNKAFEVEMVESPSFSALSDKENLDCEDGVAGRGRSGGSGNESVNVLGVSGQNGGERKVTVRVVDRRRFESLPR